MARKEVIDMTGVDDSEIGVFFITPCPAKVTEINAPNSTEKRCVRRDRDLPDLPRADLQDG